MVLRVASNRDRERGKRSSEDDPRARFRATRRATFGVSVKTSSTSRESLEETSSFASRALASDRRFAEKKVRRLISPLPPASIAGHPGLQGVRARLPRRGSPPFRHQGSRRCQGPHLRHEVPHQDPGGHRQARRRRGCHPRPPWCVPSRATARPAIACTARFAPPQPRR